MRLNYDSESNGLSEEGKRSPQHETIFREQIIDNPLEMFSPNTRRQVEGVINEFTPEQRQEIREEHRTPIYFAPLLSLAIEEEEEERGLPPEEPQQSDKEEQEPQQSNAPRKPTQADKARYRWHKKPKESFSDFLKRTGDGTKSSGNGLYNDEIDRIMSRFKDFKGCIMHNEIKKLLPDIQPHSRVAFVINTDPSNKEGQHWQAVYIDARMVLNLATLLSGLTASQDQFQKTHLKI